MTQRVPERHKLMPDCDVRNAEGRTRTADLRVMKPISSQCQDTPKRLDFP
jgi:hypothetical protein